MKKVICLVLLSVLCAVMFSACGCSHEWAEATCTSPKTCSLCGETEGEALGHTAGEWKVETEATIFGAGKRIRPCTRCGTAVSTERYELVNFFEGGKSLFTPEEYYEFYTQLAEGIYSGMEIKAVENYGVYTVIMSIDGVDTAKVYFYSEGNSADKGERGVDTVEFKFLSSTAQEYMAEISEAMMIHFMALDPTVGISDAGSMCTKLFEGVTYNSDGIAYLDNNGLSYTFFVDSDGIFYLYAEAPVEE